MADKNVAGVILAAGGSSRLGEPKQLIELGGLPLVRKAALSALEAGALPVVVVLGAENDQILPALEGLDNVRIALNSRWKSGLASSVAAGLAALSEDEQVDGAMLVLADQPFVDAHSLKNLIDAFGESRLVASAYSNTVGVPAIIGREFFPELMELQGDRGAGPWLRARSADVTKVPLPVSPLDIDTRDDIELLRQLD
jgi:molybdenum cofactor cytidylyltransferase